MPLFDLSFLPTTQKRQSRQKLDSYAQLYTTYIILIQQQGDAMRYDTQRMEAAYNDVAAEFAAEQNAFAKNNLGASYILADLNEYASRCDTCPQTFQE
jgi:hypothetical protein